MKERLIDGVIAKMSGVLSPQHLFVLRRALDDELTEFDVTSAPEGVEKHVKPMMIWRHSSSLPSVLRAALRKRLATTKILFVHSLMRLQRNCMM